MDDDTIYLPGEMTIISNEAAVEFLAGRDPDEIRFFDGAPCLCHWAMIGGGLIIEFVEGE